MRGRGHSPARLDRRILRQCSVGGEIRRYLILFRALRDVCHLRDAGTNYLRDDVPEHLAIVRPLLKSDAEGAARAMDRHIRSATDT